MKHIDVVIPTRNRFERLMDTLHSIPRKKEVQVVVVCDGDHETFRLLSGWSSDCAMPVQCDSDKHTLIRMIYDEKVNPIDPTMPYFDLISVGIHKGSVYCRNYALQNCYDGVLYATDDIVFQDCAIELAFELFNERFPDDDGVLGFQQDGTGGSYHESGVALVGQKFLQRYPDKQLFFPGYFHFSCQEIAWLARKVGRFQSDKRLRLTHFHPAFRSHRHLLDQTHVEARVHRKRDHDLIKERQAKGLIWGDGPSD